VDYGYLEMMGFLSILECYDGRHFNFLELGAGIGYWCTVLAAVIEYGILPKHPVSYRSLAVEAESTHYQLAIKNISAQDINATVVNKAVTNTIGTGLFSTEDPYLRWGQHLLCSWATGQVAPELVREVMAEIDSLVDDCHLVETPFVATTTVDSLLAEYSFDEISLAHLDVQAEEVNVLKGARKAIQNKKIEHFIIEVHSGAIGNALKKLLFPSYNLIASAI
jgi:FkbM family methyltransferase